MTISVVVPHLNQPEALRRCLTSLAEQAHDMVTDTEIIVVDNGSTELPVDICRTFPAVRLVQEPDPGPGPARNTGVQRSTGEILAFIDADCIADRNWIKSLHDALTAACSPQIVGGDVRIAMPDPARPAMLEAYESIFAYRQKNYIEQQGFSGTGNLAMHRTVHRAVGPFAGIDVAEDRDWGHRATRLGFRIAYLPQMIVYHPARQSMAELRDKWDRHISHDFVEKAQGRAGRLRWLLLMLAVAVSPLVQLPMIIMSDRVKTVRGRSLAFLVLLRIRFYRVVRMADFLFRGSSAATSQAWNRQNQ